MADVAMNAPTLTRRIFTTSRLAEFCEKKEVINQTGHPVEDWPLVILKELVDNSLDAAEEARIAPVIRIVVSQDGISVTDNGPGLALETIEGIRDYTVRVSSREAYVSPARGAQGNALKTIIAMGFAINRTRGETIIESRGVAHRITFSIDHIRRVPQIEVAREPSPVKDGTRIDVKWPVVPGDDEDDLPWSFLDGVKARFLQVAQDYTWFNPHLTLTVKWDRGAGAPVEWAIAATDPGWRKWKPSDPTSPHWYNCERLGRLIGANIAHAEDGGTACPTVLAFIREFRGLSSTARAKAICDSVGAARESLAVFYGDGMVSGRVTSLLAEMRKGSRPIKPKDLGVIGKDHLARKFAEAGADLASFDYRCANFEHDGLPYIAEFAFGYCPDGANERRIITGVNWGVSIGADPFRRLGPYGESLSAILNEQRLGPGEPIVAVLHLACPRIAYLDRGKSSIAIPGARSW